MLTPPTPDLFFETATAYQRTEALRAAVGLDLFTAIGEGARTSGEIAGRVQVAERGARSLCDYLTAIGFLTKEDGLYGLTPDTAAFLDRCSPSYLGGAVDFIVSPTIANAFQRLTDAVRIGGTAVGEGGTLAPEHPVWVEFARAMAPLMAPAAELTARVAVRDRGRPLKVLDVAAGHGLFGLAVARLCPQAVVTALDWPNVLEVAEENARDAGVSSRFKTLPGSAFEVELEGGYDLVILANFLHHFDEEGCARLLRRVYETLSPGGRAAAVEFVPNDDRVTPPQVATFSLTMLATTPAGDAYTFAEYERMFRSAGFSRCEVHALSPTLESVVIAEKGRDNRG